MTRRSGRNWMSWALLALAIAQFVATAISLWETNRGLVRMLDFVREPSIYLSGVIFALALFARSPVRGAVMALSALSAAINLYRIWPYTMLAGAQIPLADVTEPESCFTVLSFNVLQSNREYGEVGAMIERVDPDMLLLMETNRVWADALEPQLSGYPQRLADPLDNTYGMIFASRIEVESARMVANTASNTPTLYATLAAPNGARFELIGLHPRPPRVGESTEARDENIARAGALTPEGLANVLAIGDFNDVPWSRTTQRFVEEGGYDDPRAGRGSFPTFPAGYTLRGWPLDQLFAKNGVEVAGFERLDANGSDHLPLLARVCVDPESE
ncbi:MAG: endonuclease/exonuclease/phosphatase family protein [Erythrobacter sp.]